MTSTRLHSRVDVLVVGGGVAGLWSLHALLAEGFDAWLVEKKALGAAQSIQAQGIVHGGGKYALRSVADVESMRAIREMPDRWRRHLTGSESVPDLRDAHVASPCCWLWLPRGSWRARWEAWGLLPILRHGGVLACPPVPVDRDQWPEILRRHALRAYRMEEPVLDTRSVTKVLAEPVADRLLLGEPVEIGPPQTESDGVARRRVALAAPSGERLELDARVVVLTAGAGNAALLDLAQADGATMQERPLRMLLLRGPLPALHGHCIAGGRTRITVTSSRTPEGDTVWQVGGEVAERSARTTDVDGFHRDAVAELRACLPGLDLAHARVSSYAAVRAEARTADVRRPSGVQVKAVAPGVIVGWPTKWAMAPLLAEEVRREVHALVPAPSAPEALLGAGGWPRPPVAPHPWEAVAWSPVPSARAE